MSVVVIKVEKLSKIYHLGTISHGTLYQDLQSTWAKFRGKEDPNSMIGSDCKNDKKSLNQDFYSLKDISFEIEKGEIVGIIGHNGAGKSTLLKLLSRVTAPSQGSIMIKGRIASLLEVGTGFHPELTGRENTFLNGAILGMKKREIEEKFEDIVRFSDIEKFIDTPVKRYSSGMYVRLAFAVAAHLESEILIIDEVLAVGDTAFQKKCLGKMGEVARGGRTVLFVSHNMGAMSSLCQRGLLLDHGKLVYSGPIDDVIGQYTYNLHNSEETNWIGNEGDDQVRLVKTWVIALNQENTFKTTSDIEIGMVVETLKDVEGLVLGFTLQSSFEYELAYCLYDDEKNPPPEIVIPGKHTIKFVIPKNTLSVGTYKIFFDVGIHMRKKIINNVGNLRFRLENYDGLGLRYPVPEVRGRASLFRPKWFSVLTDD